MTTSAIALQHMDTAVKKYMSHYGPDSKPTIVRLLAELSTVVFHRSFATVDVAKNTLQTFNIRLDEVTKDAMVLIATTWWAMLDNPNMLIETTAHCILLSVNPDEPEVPVKEITATLDKYKIVMAMFYLRHALVLGETK